MVFYDSNYQWIETQQPGVVHNLCDYIYQAIQVVLHAHKEDYPNNPVEPGALRHLPFIIQSMIDEAVAYHNSIKLFGRVWACWYGFKTSITHYQNNLDLFRQLTPGSAYLHYALNEVSLSS